MVITLNFYIQECSHVPYNIRASRLAIERYEFRSREQQKWQFQQRKKRSSCRIKTGLLRPYWIKREKAQSMEGKRTATTAGKVSLDRRRCKKGRGWVSLRIFKTNWTESAVYFLMILLPTYMWAIFSDSTSFGTNLNSSSAKRTKSPFFI